jgi:putative ABC transport system ATP-binding protein/macrolide transport system ATP-binding/permease protein/lipoprotein-releasing system ATP-binding protein
MLLESRGLSKVFTAQRGKIHAVDGIDLEVQAGEFLAIRGPSGSGKSTLLGMLGGLCRPSAGTVSVDGVDLWSLRPGALADFRARRFGFLFQFAGLLPNLRAIDNIALPALLGGTGYKPAYDRAQELLGQVGLANRWDAYPGELSGGQQRRVALARALVNRPTLLLADEPTNDLDEQAEREVLALLRELRRVHNATLIVVTHDVHLAQQADRVLLLPRGQRVSVTPKAITLVEWPSPAAPLLPPPLPIPSCEPEFSPGNPTPPGAGLGRFLVAFVGWVLLVTACLWGGNYVMARVQRQTIVEKQEVRKRSEELALQKLRANIEDVIYRDDGGYEIRLYIDNADPKTPFHVLGPDCRVFVQVDRSWQEVSARAIGFEKRGVHEITGKQVYRIVFRADLRRYEELIKGYLHVRVSNIMVVSASTKPTEDLFQRSDDYYAYLKPQTVSEEEVRRRNGWKEGALVPRWIGMPSH